ncbi:DUF3618 domain-containing protein [Aestuariibius insulae]|uniref:DUF3618 domain-containing protein n=1 Tax=Aestuariibius insulae TaxID=2058287 RepID=UPI00345EFB6E
MPDDKRTPEEIEREIEQERENLTQTLNRLQDSFSPEAVVDKIGTQIRENGNDVARTLVNTIRENPVAFALTGIGLAWLTLGAPRDKASKTRALSRPHEVPSYPSLPPAAKGEWARKAGQIELTPEQQQAEMKASVARLKLRSKEWRDRLSEGTEGLSEEARLRVLIAREKALFYRDQFERGYTANKEKAGDLFEEYPLVAGALSMAFGAAIGGALPRSDFEDREFGRYSDDLFNEAEDIFKTEIEKVGTRTKNAARDATDAAKDSLTGTSSPEGSSHLATARTA